MRQRTFFIIIILSAIAAATLLPYFSLVSVQPDLLLICAVIAGLTFQLSWAIFFALVAGFCKDIFAPGVFGSNSLLFCLWAFLVWEFSRKVSSENNLLRVALVLLVAILNGIAAGFISAASGNYLSTGIFLRILVLESIYTALVSPLIFKVCK